MTEQQPPGAMPEVLVVGGTGRIGWELLTLLNEGGIPVRALIRADTSANLLPAPHVQAVKGNLDDRDSVRAALGGIKTVFMVTRDHSRQAAREGSLIDTAAEAGVEKIVKLSAFAAGMNPPPGYGALHRETEKKLQASGLRWVILRPYMFMQNFLDLTDLIRSRGVLPMPLGAGRISLIDARDVALAARAVIISDAHDGQIHELTGPDVLDMEQCAEKFATVIKRPVRYLPLPFWLAALMMRLQGVSAWDVRMRRQLFRMIAADGEARVTDDFEKISGEKPRTLRSFVMEHFSAD